MLSLLKTSLDGFSRWFWNEDIWLPPGITWTHIRDTSKVKYAQIEQLYTAVLVAVVLFFVRIFLDKYVFRPIGRRYDLRDRSKLPSMGVEKDRSLQNAFYEHGPKADGAVLLLVSKKLGMAEREVQRWWRKRNRLEKPTVLDKFAESAWRGTFYASVFCYGLWCLADKPWLWDTMHCWYDFPHHSVTNDVLWYYLIELSFYISLMFSQFLDVKRKDFWQMFVHHIVTVLLITLSWTCNLTRVGTLVMIIHDFADVPLEAAKMAKYIEKQSLADFLFVIFTLSWVFSRLGLYPYRVIYSTSYQATFVIEMFSAYYIFNTLLLALQVLHVIWTIFIVRVVVQALSSQGISDLRSEDESSTTDEKED